MKATVVIAMSAQALKKATTIKAAFKGDVVTIYLLGVLIVNDKHKIWTGHRDIFW